MSGRRKLENLAHAKLAAVPINDGGLSSLAPIKEESARHNERERPHGDVHSPVVDFVFRQAVNKGGQSSRHSDFPELASTERSDRGGSNVNASLANSGNILGCFSEPCAILHQPANDNEPWGEAA